MADYQDKVLEAAAYLKQRLEQPPVLGMLTGTGLGQSAESMEVGASFHYQELPHFPVSTVQSHRGRLLAGRLQHKPIIAMQGRFHLYEGYSPLEVTFPIRVMRALGVTTLILTNASGGLNPRYRPGDIMIITDHLNLTGENPLVGPNEDRWGPRFPDMAAAYDPRLVEAAEQAARTGRVPVQKGIYAGLKGPSLETPAEVRYLRTMGAEAVGFSTVQEVIAAVHAGMRVLGLSTITNVHDPEHPAPSSVDEIIAVANRAAPAVDLMIAGVAAAI